MLRPYKDRFRRMLSSRDPGLREVAAWALGRTGDLDVVPDLIGALTDREESVVVAARTGLQLLSRKIDGYGPADPSATEERKKAAEAWQHWYELIRPLGKGADGDTARLRRARPDAQPTAPRCQTRLADVVPLGSPGLGYARLSLTVIWKSFPRLGFRENIDRRPARHAISRVNSRLA